MALHFLVDEGAELSRSTGDLAADAEVALRGTLAGAEPGDTVTLTGAEAHHAAVVRRVRVGEEVTVGDGLETVNGGIRVGFLSTIGGGSGSIGSEGARIIGSTISTCASVLSTTTSGRR